MGKTLSCSSQGLVYSRALDTCAFASPYPECPPNIPQMDPVAVKVCSGMHSFRYYAGVRCSASCPLGYVAASTTYSCETSGNWSGGALTCQPGTCPMLSPPSNGYVAGSSMTGVTDETRAFGCDPGYILVGASSTTCQADGGWSAPSPTCQRKFRCF